MYQNQRMALVFCFWAAVLAAVHFFPRFFDPKWDVLLGIVVGVLPILWAAEGPTR